MRDDARLVPERPAAGRQPGAGCRRLARPGDPGLRVGARGGGQLAARRRFALVAASLAGRAGASAGTAGLAAGDPPRAGRGRAGRADGRDRCGCRLLEPPLRAGRRRPRSAVEALAAGCAELQRRAAARAVDDRDRRWDAVPGVHAVLAQAAEHWPTTGAAAGAAPGASAAQAAIAAAIRPGSAARCRLGRRAGGLLEARGGGRGRGTGRVCGAVRALRRGPRSARPPQLAALASPASSGSSRRARCGMR